MEQFRQQTQHQTIAYGVNVDDQGDYRPGQRAAQQHGVAAPLLQAGLTKAEVRQLARDAGLRIWDKPASPCLSSRIEYGRAVTPEALAAVEQGEEALRELGFEQFRVRHHGDIVRIEIAADELPRAMSPEMAAEFTRIFKALGFKYVTLDLEGFRSGSMNDILPIETPASAQTGMKPGSQSPASAREIIKSRMFSAKGFWFLLMKRLAVVFLLVCAGCSAQSNNASQSATASSGALSPELQQRIEHQVRAQYELPPEVTISVGPHSPQRHRRLQAASP